MTSELRWSVLVLVLAIAGVLALWPRDAPRPGQSPEAAAPPHRSAPGTEAPAVTDAELAALRDRANLDACPTPSGPAAAPTGAALSGITVPCLGAPGDVNLGAGLAGRPALLNLWASWCAPCREEMPALAGYATQPGAIPVVGINVQDHPASALRLLADLGVHYPSVTDPNRTLQSALRVPRVLPISILLRPDGSIQSLPPQVFRSSDDVRRTVQRHLEQPTERRPSRHGAGRR